MAGIKTYANTGAGKTIDNLHGNMHEGLAYSMSTYIATVNNSGTGDNSNCSVQFFISPTRDMHLYWKITCEGDSTVSLFESAVSQDNGGGIQCNTYNLNRSYASLYGVYQNEYESSVSIWQDPNIKTHSDKGTSIYSDYLETGASSLFGSKDENFLGWILNNEYDYLLNITNIETTAKRMAVYLWWCEDAEQSTVTAFRR